MNSDLKSDSISYLNKGKNMVSTTDTELHLDLFADPSKLKPVSKIVKMNKIDERLIREKLLSIDDSKSGIVHSLQFKEPTTALIISIFGGAYGIDRFYIGDTGMGVGKLLTCGGLGIWAIVDWFLIQGATKEKNLEKFNQAMLY
jgi:TM2 domain-containing membrane protein YozV